MKIAIDISQIIYPTGVSVYTRNLVKRLLEMDRQNEYLLFGGYLRRKKDLVEFAEALPAASRKFIPVPPRLLDVLFNRIRIVPVEKIIGDVDVFHSSDWTQPKSKAFKVTTVHDLAPLRYPRLTHPLIYSVHKARLSLVKKEADRVIVPSEFTKSEVVDWGIKEEKVRVIPEAVEEIFCKRGDSEVSRIRERYRLKGSYIMTVGAGGRKNTQRLIKAYELARAGEDLKLVIVSRNTPQFKFLRGVVVIDDISREDLPALYSGAEALVYPSLYEGFGLPILEAFACGVPVVTSDLSSTGEIASSAGVLVDPYSVESVSEGIKTALRGKTGLTRKGLKRVGEFSWEKTAARTLEVYREAEK